MGQKRTIYFNDTRHFYLFALDPPLSMEQVLLPIAEATGTSVDTFAFSVDGGNGLFYPSNAGLRYAALDPTPMQGSYDWRARKILQDLDDQGLDILTLLIDEAHHVGMDFFASLRMGGYLGVDPNKLVINGGKGLGHPELRHDRFAVLQELATQYDIQGVELDLAAPGGTAWHFPPNEGPQYAPVMTEYLGQIADMMRNRPGQPGQVGVRVYPTEEMCLRHGLDVRTWFKAGIVDWVMPMLYSYFVLDADMPIEWLTEAAAEAGVSVYARLQPWEQDESTGALQRIHADPATLRGAACNFLDKGVDGIYAHSLSWPLGDTERGVLAELGDRQRLQQGDKRYVIRRRQQEAAALGYDAPLPFEIPAADPNKRYPISLLIADDIDAETDRIRQVILTLKVLSTVSQDDLILLLNGQSLAAETCLKRPRDSIAPYDGLELEYYLEKVRPHRGRNLLEITLASRPDGLIGGLSIEAIELSVVYHS